MASYLDELDKKDLEIAVRALKDWFGFQSELNRTELYNKCSELFKSDFNPAEYDEVE